MTNIYLNIFFITTLFINLAKLNIVVKNIQVGKGSIVVEIYDNSKDFFKKSIAAKTVKATNQSFGLFI